MFTEAAGVKLCSAQREAAAIACQGPLRSPHLRSLCTDKGLVWIECKAIWQKQWGSVWGPSSRGGAGPVTTWRQARWEQGASRWWAWSCCPPTLSTLQRLRMATWQGELSGAGVLPPAPSLLSLRAQRHGNTAGLARGSAERQAPGTEPGAHGRPMARATGSSAPLNRCFLTSSSKHTFTKNP